MNLNDRDRGQPFFSKMAVPYGDMKTKAQSTLEYAILIAVVVAAVLAMSAYIKRGMQGRLKAGADELSGVGAYVPQGTTSLSTYTKSSEESTKSYTEKDSVTGVDYNITKSTENIIQSVDRIESIVPFDQEPVR